MADGGIEISPVSVFNVAVEVGSLESCADDDGGVVSTGIGVGTGSDSASAVQMILEEQKYPLGQGWSSLHGMAGESSSSSSSSSCDEGNALLDTANEDSIVSELVEKLLGAEVPMIASTPLGLTELPALHSPASQAVMPTQQNSLGLGHLCIAAPSEQNVSGEQRSDASCHETPQNT